MRSVSRREFVRTATAGAAALAFLRGDLFAAAAAQAAVGGAELAGYDALGLAALVRSKQASPLELVDAAIARAETVNPKLNAIITPLYEAARKRAVGPLPDGPFTGVPILLKDLLPYEGVRLAFGCRFFKDNVAEESHPVAARIEGAGMVVFGKTNTPEFGLLPTTEPHLFGPTKSPWHPAYSPGGSSGGSAAAVAAGIVPLAQASDGGGSIRVPASCCGLFGMKVTRDRHPMAPKDAAPGDLSVRGFVSRTVRDSKAAVQAMSLSPLEGSPLPPPVYPEDIRLRPLRVAFSTRDLRGVEAHPDCVKAVQQAAKLCAELGHHVEEASPPVDGEAFNDAFLVFWAVRPAGLLTMLTEELGGPPPRDAFEPWTWKLAEHFATLPEDAVPKAVHHMRMVTGRMAAFHQRYDVWLTPVLGTPPIRIGEVDQDRTYDELVDQLVRYVAYTPLANATGQPAMSVPLHWTEDGLPVGTQFVARPGEEALLFALAEQLEQAQPWAHRRPAIFADV